MAHRISNDYLSILVTITVIDVQLFFTKMIFRDFDIQAPVKHINQFIARYDPLLDWLSTTVEGMNCSNNID